MKQLVTTLLLVLLSFSLHAQTWQWGKRGGGSSNGSNVTPQETIVDMTTDSKGNVYAIAVIEASGLPNFTGGTFTAYGNRDIALISFRCDGTLRWRKTIGGGNIDYSSVQAIDLDTLGHLYVAGSAISSQFATTIPVSFEGDTTLPGTNQKTQFVAQYDTAGNLNWLRQPMPDATPITNSDNWFIISMAVTSSGDAFCLAYLNPGLIGGSNQVVPSAGVYMMRYDVQGTLLSITPFQMGYIPGNTSFQSFGMKRTKSGKFIIAGHYPAAVVSDFTLSGQPVTYSMFAACFSPQGAVLWKKFGNDSSSGFFHRPSLDAQGNIYLAGASRNGKQFNGTALPNILGLPNAFPLAIKMDSAGNNIWASTSGTNGTAYGYAGILRGSEYVVTGGYPGKLQWQGLSTQLSHAVNTGYDPFLVRLDAQTGQAIFLDSLAGNGATDYGTALAADASGNVYVGGRFENNISIGGTVYNSVGGASDFFIAKYGTANCNCTVPTASYTKTMNNAARTVSVTYTGVTVGLDSVIWQWGDGQKLKVTSNYGAVQTHTYAAGAGSSFNVCATAYSSCGQNQSCQTVGFTASVEGLAALRNVLVYPNPATDVLFIDGAEAGTTYRLLSVLGQEVSSGVVEAGSYTLPVANMPPGTYTLVLTDKSGARAAVRVMKR